MAHSEQGKTCGDMMDWQRPIIQQVRDGYRSVRNAAIHLGWTIEDVQMAAWGEIRQ